MSEEYAAGFYALLRALEKRPPVRARFLKGHVTGPLTAGISYKDEQGRDIIHNEQLYDAVVKKLAMNAAWQIRKLGAFGKPVIVFLDEPAMETLGSAFSPAAPELVAEKLDEIIEAIHEAGGIAGIHCCGNADWPLIFNTKVDIVNFDAFGYLERVLLYPAEIRAFFARGGALAWGIVPTGDVHRRRDRGRPDRETRGRHRAPRGRRDPARHDPAPEHHHALLRPGQPEPGARRGDPEADAGDLRAPEGTAVRSGP